MVDPHDKKPGEKASRSFLFTVAILILLKAFWFTVASTDSFNLNRETQHFRNHGVRAAPKTQKEEKEMPATQEKELETSTSASRKNNATWVPDTEQDEHYGIWNRSRNATGIALAVMGEAEKFSSWADLFQLLTESFEVTLFYGSFDQQINSTKCTNCTTLFIPGTTWTEGRNKLAEAILCEERTRDREFELWGFADDDVYDMVCKVSAQSCWYKLFHFLTNDVPSNAVVVAPHFNDDLAGTWYVVTTFDAALNFFKRDYVPMLLPYVNMARKRSQWLSQYALFCVMHTCFRGGAIETSMRISNLEHRPYKRGLNKNLAAKVIGRNYSPYLEYEEAACLALTQRDELMGPFATLEELAPFIPPVDADRCSRMPSRFKAWENQIAIC